jgi:hypothetical protein
MNFPPPHMILYERLNDRETHLFWSAYTSRYADQCDFEEVDAALTNSMDDFAKWFLQWTSFTPSRSTVRVRVLLIWHAHFLTLACQQMLRRTLEQRSFRCRVWFHIEEPLLQQAILSRCIVRRMKDYHHVPIVEGPPLDTSLWDSPTSYETKLQEAMDTKVE